MTDDPGEWEEYGREMLAAELERAAADVAGAFRGVAEGIGQGKPIREGHVSDLRTALEQASHPVKYAAGVCPETEPAPDLWTLLDENGRAEYKRQATPSGVAVPDERATVPGTFEISVDVPDEVREAVREHAGEDATEEEIQHALADRISWEWGPQPEFDD